MDWFEDQVTGRIIMRDTAGVTGNDRMMNDR